MMSFSYRAKLSKKLNKCTYRPIWSEFCADPFNRLGEMRDHTFEHQRYRASGLNLITAAIVLWNTVYIERAVNALREQGQEIDTDHLQYLSPLGWEHINLTGDYLWKSNARIGNGKFRPLRRL